MSLDGRRTMLTSPTWPTAGALVRPDLPVRGRALVARSTELAPRAAPDTVLVVERLPAAWVPLLRNVAAVVAETGGALSGAATLLRERGIPAVFGVDGCRGGKVDRQATPHAGRNGVARPARGET
jgi:phosphohistidine swiveling domain-containing protein